MKPKPIRVAAVFPVGDEYAVRLLDGASRYARERGHVRLYDRFYARNARKPAAASLQAFDGALVCLHPRDHWVGALRAAGLALVNTTGDGPVRGVPSVVFDGVSVIEAAVDHLAAPGRRCVAYLAANRGRSAPLAQRQAVFLRRVRQRGMMARACDIGSDPGLGNAARFLGTERGRQLLSFLRELPRPAALWAQEDSLAVLALAAAGRLGLRVPGDLAVLGMCDYQIASCCNPSLSSIPQPGELVGYEAMRLLDGLLHERRLRRRLVELPSPAPILRESTGGTLLADQRLQRIRDLIAERAGQGLRVTDLLPAAGVSQHTFSKQFSAAVGRTPGAEIRRVRAERAKMYLRTTTLGIERIAELCGFTGYSAFCNFLRREVGVSPRDYRTPFKRRRRGRPVVHRRRPRRGAS